MWLATGWRKRSTERGPTCSGSPFGGFGGGDGTGQADSPPTARLAMGFGWSAAIDGDTLVVGADEAGNSGPGAAYGFRDTKFRLVGNPPDRDRQLTASDGAAGDVFGLLGRHQRRYCGGRSAG